MRRREFIALLGIVAAWPLAATAQQSDSGRQVRIGVVAPVSPSPDMLNAFRDAMRDRGYIEGSKSHAVCSLAARDFRTRSQRGDRPS